MTVITEWGQEGLELLLRSLRLPSFVECHAEVAIKAEKAGWSFGQYLYHLAETEALER